MRLRFCNLPKRTAIGLLLTATLPAGCGGGSVSMTLSSDPAIPAANSSSSTPPAVAQAESAGTTVNPAIATADNAFGLNLFQNLIAGATGNVAIAPINVAMALQILYNGAAGTTQQAMAQTLQLGSLSTQDLNNANAALQASLLNPDPEVQIDRCQFAVDASQQQPGTPILHANRSDLLRSDGRGFVGRAGRCE